VIFQALLVLDAQRAPLDQRTLFEYLRESGQLDAAGGAIYISQLVWSTSATVEHDARKVREAHIARTLQAGLGARLGKLTAGSIGDQLHDLSELVEELAGELGGKHDLAALAISAADLLGLKLPARRALLEGVLLEGALSGTHRRTGHRQDLGPVLAGRGRRSGARLVRKAGRRKGARRYPGA